MSTVTIPPTGVIRCTCGKPLLRLAADGSAYFNLRVVKATGTILVMVCGCKLWWGYEAQTGKLSKQ